MAPDAPLFCFWRGAGGKKEEKEHSACEGLPRGSGRKKKEVANGNLQFVPGKQPKIKRRGKRKRGKRIVRRPFGVGSNEKGKRQLPESVPHKNRYAHNSRTGGKGGKEERRERRRRECHQHTSWSEKRKKIRERTDHSHPSSNQKKAERRKERGEGEKDKQYFPSDIKKKGKKREGKSRSQIENQLTFQHREKGGKGKGKGKKKRGGFSKHVSEKKERTLPGDNRLPSPREGKGKKKKKEKRRSM